VQAGDESCERLRAAIDAAAVGDVASLVAEARDEARARVRAMLTEALTQAMVERAREALELSRRPEQLEQLAPSAAPGSQRLAADHDAVGPCGLYVYCVACAQADGAPAGLEGIAPGRRVTVVHHGALAAFVSEVPLEEFGEERLREQLADMGWLERTARAHEAVVDAIRKRHTLVPMRLCSIFRDESGVREMLGREAAALGDALVYLERKTEWGVKAFIDPGHVAAPEMDAGAVTPGFEGAAYMKRRLRERHEDARANRELELAAAQIHGRLQSVAVEGRASPSQRPEVSGHPGQMILNGVYLVEDEHQQSFKSEVEELGTRFERMGVEVVLTGPWPAYNFVRGTIGAAC
jgi:hypothetical protein